MTRYRYVGSDERHLLGLSHGGNATLHRDDADLETGEQVPHGQPAGSALVVRPGDEIEVDGVYPHALMVNIATGETDVEAAAQAADSSAETEAETASTGTAGVAPSDDSGTSEQLPEQDGDSPGKSRRPRSRGPASGESTNHGQEDQS